MPTQGDYSLFKRLVGDDEVDLIDDASIDDYLDDAARERSYIDTDIPIVLTFDGLAAYHKAEAIYQAAINWWWNRAASLSGKHSQTVGQASMNAGEKYDRAMRMIEMLQTRLAELIASGSGSIITFGNLSRFSKSTLTRLGGKSEESTLNG